MVAPGDVDDADGKGGAAVTDADRYRLIGGPYATTEVRADGWTPDEDDVCRRHTLAECCRLLPGRTRTAISIRRSRLKAAAGGLSGGG